MSEINKDNVVEKLGSLTVLEIIALTRQLEKQWGVKAEPLVTQQVRQVEETGPVQTEFNVVLASVPSDKKMAVIKLVRELLTLGLKESKDLVEAAPKTLKEGVSKEEAGELASKLSAAGAVIEVK